MSFSSFLIFRNFFAVVSGAIFFKRGFGADPKQVDFVYRNDIQNLCLRPPNFARKIRAVFWQKTAITKWGPFLFLLLFEKSNSLFLTDIFVWR